jgi:hypothetical protein
MKSRGRPTAPAFFAVYSKSEFEAVMPLREFLFFPFGPAI